MVQPADLITLARGVSRAEFIAQHEGFFLIGELSLEQPLRTDSFDTYESKPDQTHAVGRPGDGQPGAVLLVLAVRKVQESVPSMITVGRTANNDIVVPDINVSRLHACFRVHPDRVDLADAGSVNGTFVNGKELVPKGPAQILVPGDEVAFAHLLFSFVGAAATWERVHSRKG